MQQFGLLIWTIAMPLFFVFIIWIFQLWRTQDRALALKSALSWQSITFVIGLWILVMFSRFAGGFSA